MTPTILVPHDFSAAADRALEWAQAHRAAIGNANLRVVHVFNPIPMGFAAMPIPPALPNEQIGDAKKLLHDRTAPLGTGVTSDVVLASATADAILEDAKRCNADMVVMGTHGRTGVSRLVLGSVAEQVIRHAPCPVVTMHE
jgi:universal stress protein A